MNEKEITVKQQIDSKALVQGKLLPDQYETHSSACTNEKMRIMTAFVNGGLHYCKTRKMLWMVAINKVGYWAER